MTNTNKSIERLFSEVDDYLDDVINDKWDSIENRLANIYKKKRKRKSGRISMLPTHPIRSIRSILNQDANENVYLLFVRL